MYDYPNAISNDAYKTLINKGVETSIGHITFNELVFHSMTGPNFYGASTLGTIIEPVLNLGSTHILFMFSDVIKDYGNINMGATTADIGGIGIYYDGNNHLCPLDGDGNFLTQYAGPSIDTFPDYVAPAAYPACQICAVMTYQSQNGGYVPDIAMGGDVDPVNHPDAFLKDAYSYSLKYFNLVGNDIFEYALFGKYWNEEDQTPDDISEGGGGGDGWRPDYELELPTLPSLSILNTGMYHMYHVTETEMQSLATYLWSSSFFDNIIKNFTSPFENLISLHIIPIAVTEAPEAIKIGNLDSGISSHELTTSYYQVSCGSVYIKPIYKSFADYDTRITLYLPFIGYNEIDISDLMGGYLYVDYTIDAYSGDCVAVVRATNQHDTVKHTIMEKRGNCAMTFPISGANYTGFYSGLIGAAGNFATGNVVGAATGLMNLRPQYGKAGNYGGVGGYFAHRYPYIIYHSPTYQVPQNYNSYIGGISNIYAKLGNCVGWTVVKKDCYWANEINCTEEEKQMIKDILESGVYINL